MNIIRTAAVELTSIPAIAYKQKLSAGGSGLRILRLDQDAVGVFTIDRRTGDAIAYKTLNDSLFPDEAVNEALTLLTGLPFSARGKIKVSVFETPKEEEIDVVESAKAADMVGSDEYNAILERYSDVSGKLNYTLLNRDFIKFAARSKVVSEMVSENANEDEIIVHILRSRAALLADKKDSISVEEGYALLETIDEIDPRSAFKELKLYLRGLKGKK